MPFLILAFDRKGVSRTRERLRDAHRAHLRAQGKKLLASGALLADDKRTVIGGLSLLATESRREAEDFAFRDPYELAGVRRVTKVIRWRQRWKDGKLSDSR
jgi:uncharacterized protein YciI